MAITETDRNGYAEMLSDPEGGSQLVHDMLVADEGMTSAEADAFIADLLGEQVDECDHDKAPNALNECVDCGADLIEWDDEPTPQLAPGVFGAKSIDEVAELTNREGDAGHIAEADSGDCANPTSDGMIFTEQGGAAPLPETEEPEMTNPTAPAARSAKTLVPCRCAAFLVVIREWETSDGQPEIDTIATGCTATTLREFAPGHDAKLKGLLIRAGVADQEIRIEEGGLAITTSAEGAAMRFGFADMVIEGIAKGKEKAADRAAKADAKHAAKAAAKHAAKAAREAAKATKKDAAPAPAVKDMGKAKVGRWERDGEFTDAGFVYTDKQGVTQIAATGFVRIA